MELVIVQIIELSYCTNIVQIIEYYGTKLLYELLTKLLHKLYKLLNRIIAQID